MRNEIIIGSGDKLCSSVNVFSINGNETIYSNFNCYSCHDLIFKSELIVFKHTKEGKKISNMISQNKDYETIIKYLNTLVLSKVKLNDVFDSLEEIKKEAYDKGIYDTKKQIKTFLNY